MNRVKSILSSANLTSASSGDGSETDSEGGGGKRVFPLSRGYTQWETDEVIANELYRNMALALGQSKFFIRIYFF